MIEKPTLKSVDDEEGKWIVEHVDPSNYDENCFIQSVTKNGKKFRVLYHTELVEEEE